MKMYCLESRSRGISYMKYINERQTEFVIFCVETAFLQRVIEGKINRGIEVRGRRRRRRRKLLNDLKERRGYTHLKEGTLDHTMWRARFARDCGRVVRQSTE
jgi:hypothetical protein